MLIIRINDFEFAQIIEGLEAKLHFTCHCCNDTEDTKVLIKDLKEQRDQQS